MKILFWMSALWVSAFAGGEVVRLHDKAVNMDYGLVEVRGVHLYPEKKKPEAVYQSLKKKIAAFSKKSLNFDGSSNPASVFCTTKLKGINVTLSDEGGNEYAICKFEDGTMVDAWELFRLVK